MKKESVPGQLILNVSARARAGTMSDEAADSDRCFQFGSLPISLSLQAQNGCYIFKWLEKKSKE